MEFNDDVKVDAFHVENDERKMPARTTSHSSSNRKSISKASGRRTDSARKATKTVHKRMKSRDDFSDDEAIAMIEEENKRPSSKFNAEGERQGFGSFYDHPCHDDSFAEKTAKIGHKDHVRTCDLTSEDQMKFCFEESDDSERSSDWKKQTGFTMKSARLRGHSRKSSTRKSNKALAAYNVKRLAEKAQKSKDANFKE